MRENCTYGSMRGIRRKTAKHVLRVAEGRAGVPDNKGRPALLYTLFLSCFGLRPCGASPFGRAKAADMGVWSVDGLTPKSRDVMIRFPIACGFRAGVT